MAYKYREMQPGQDPDKEKQQEEQNQQPGAAVPSSEKIQATLGDLELLIQALKERIQENVTANEILTANLEGWTDEAAQTVIHRFSRSIKPFLMKQRETYLSIREDTLVLSEKADQITRTLERNHKWNRIGILVNVLTAIVLIAVLK